MQYALALASCTSRAPSRVRERRSLRWLGEPFHASGDALGTQPASPHKAHALASMRGLGKATRVWLAGTPALTESSPPKLAFVVTRGFW